MSTKQENVHNDIEIIECVKSENKSKPTEIVTGINAMSRSSSPATVAAHTAEQDKQQRHFFALQYLQHVFRQHQLNLLLLQQHEQLHQSVENDMLLNNTYATECDNKVNKPDMGRISDDTQITSSNTNLQIEENNFSDHLNLNTINLTSAANGFFNRKRGRPPKNRFVEVYEHTKQTPQAIFTSFKLEKQRLNASIPFHNMFNGSSKTSRSIHNQHNTNCLTDMDTMAQEEKQIQSNAIDVKNDKDNMIALDMMLKRAESQYETGSLKQTHKEIRNTKKRITRLPMRYTPYEHAEQFNGGSDPDTTKATKILNLIPDKDSNILDNVSVVRAAGTFYPENSMYLNSNPLLLESNNRNKLKDRKLTQLLEYKRTKPISIHNNFKSNDNEDDLPQDLTVNRLNSNVDKPIDQQHRFQTEFQQLFELYQQKQFDTISHTRSTDNNYVSPKLTSSSSQRIAEKRLTLSENSNDVITSVEMTSTSIPSISNINSITKFHADSLRPIGYMKYRYNENCGYTKCAYSLHQSHFHCNRIDCQYSFCDRTRIVQHTARHDRLDELMGDDFQQYRNNTKCGQTNCVYTNQNNEVPDTNTSQSLQKKKVHYHCRKCTYACCETNKILAHRRYHNKLEHIQNAGFRKVSSQEDCLLYSNTLEICPYRIKHTHYHCLICDNSVLSRAQLNTHKHKSQPKIQTGK